jgi:carboxyl-terminal processing protease
MLNRVLPLVRSWRWMVVVSAVASAASLNAQTVGGPSQPAVEQVRIAPESQPAAISSLLEQGHTLESSGRWAEALSYYEESLREHPDEPSLEDRFEVARLHYSLDQRYADRSFRDSVQTLRPEQAAALYDDMLSKISAHYYTTPPWQTLTQRGTQSLQFALADPNFLTFNGIHTGNAQLARLIADIQNTTSRYSVHSRQDTSAVASQVAHLASQRIGLNETATLMEFTAAASGSLDHYSSYLTADQLRDIYSQIEGNFVGLGVELKADNGSLLIVRVIPHSPAEQAGVLANDRITAVDGQATKDLSTDEAASLLTGAEGSYVRVMVETAGQSPRLLSIQRSHVDVPSLENVKILEPDTGVAYIRIPAFQKTTARDLEAAMWDLHRQGMRSLVLDLRGNPGGLLTASVEMADKFIADGPIVTTRGRSEEENFNYQAHRPGTWRVPLVVLIDGDSASAAEIFAGAIKDSGRGKIVGSRSYGKGSVQGIFPLGYAGAGARITTAKFYSPKGHPISSIGITPDIDARRATPVAAGQTSAPEGAHLVAYRGAGGEEDQALQIAVQVARTLPVAAL